MGLDMYLEGEEYIPTYDGQKREVRSGYCVSEYRLDMGYWRKFAPLHCYIVNTFAAGVDECQRIDLTEDDLRKIAQALRSNALPPNEKCHGFLFGSTEWWDEDRANGDKHAKVFDNAAEWRHESMWRSVVYKASW